jgi:hypothetical protein
VLGVSTTRTTRAALVATAVGALLALSACGDDDTPTPATRPAATTPASTADSMMEHGSTPDSMMAHESMAPSTSTP